MIVDVNPHTPEWHAWRKTGIGASLAPVIMGDSPYQTKRELAERLLGLRDELPTNPAMERGLALEPMVRRALNVSLGSDAPFRADVCLANGPLLASLDGLSQSGSVVAEIKMVGRKDFAEIKKTREIPRRHRAQLAQQMLVANAERLHYAAFVANDDNTIDEVFLIIVERDADYEREVAKAVTGFWEMIQRKELPPYGPDDRVEIEPDKTAEELITEYKCLRVTLGAVQDELKEIEQRLWSKIGDYQHARLGVLNFDTYQRQGQVKIQNVPELKGIDLDKYRSKPITVRQIRIKE